MREKREKQVCGDCGKLRVTLYRNLQSLWTTDAPGLCSNCWIRRYGNMGGAGKIRKVPA